MSNWDEDVIHYKYDPIPDEPRYRKRAKRRHVKSDHKHEYEDVSIVVTGYRKPLVHIGQRCKLCGRLYDYRHTRLAEPPAGMRVFEVEELPTLWSLKVLPEDMEVK